MVVTTCSSCNQDLEIESKYLGKGILCPFCKKLFVPPLPHSGFGIAACFLAIVALMLELFWMVYRIIGHHWHVGFLSADRLRSAMGFLAFTGLVMTWIGATCGMVALTQKKKKRSSARWGLILSILPNMFCGGALGVRALLPMPAKPPEEPPTENVAPADNAAPSGDSEEKKD